MFLLLLIRSQDSPGTSKYLCVLLSYKYGKKDAGIACPSGAPEFTPGF
jgi:hypothetical protein